MHILEFVIVFTWLLHVNDAGQSGTSLRLDESGSQSHVLYLVYVYDQSIKDWLLLIWTMFYYVMIVRSHPVEYLAEGALLLGRILQAGRPVCFKGRQAY